MIAAVALAALGACGLPPDAGPVTPSTPLLPTVPRAILVAASALEVVLSVPSTDGVPATRALGPAAFRDGNVTWLGHAGFLIRLGGQSVLVDPVLSDRLELALPPQRIAAAPVLALDRVDAVLISLVDDDHYDRATLLGIARAFPRSVLIVPPRTVPDPASFGFAEVRVLAAWDSLDLAGLTITATPALHFGRRDVIGLHPHPALGWALRAGGLSVIHTGDTARGPVMAQIGARLGPFDLALVPMGAYAPEAALGDVHADPEDALAIARDLGAWRALGMHWGTFAMSMASPAEGRQRFLDAAGPGLPLPLIADIGQTIAIHP